MNPSTPIGRTSDPVAQVVVPARERKRKQPGSKPFPAVGKTPPASATTEKPAEPSAPSAPSEREHGARIDVRV